MSETAEKLLNAIKEKGISYGELSKLTGIPKSVLQRYATGFTGKIPVDRIVLIAKALNLDPQSIVDFDTETEILTDLWARKDYIIKNPPPGLDSDAMEVAYDYAGLDDRGKRAVKNVIKSEKTAYEEDLVSDRR